MGRTKGRARGQSTSISGGGDEVLTESPRSRSQNRTCPGHLRRGSDGLVSLGRFPRNPARGFHIDPYLSDSRAGPLIPEPRTAPPPRLPAANLIADVPPDRGSKPRPCLCTRAENALKAVGTIEGCPPRQR